jgi:hypothetical protein
MDLKDEKGINPLLPEIISKLPVRRALDEWHRHLPGSYALDFPAKVLVVPRHQVTNW